MALAFLALCWHRLGIPSKIYFDEIHYVPAARKLLALTRANPEHPLLSKEAIAAAIALLGDRPLVWRIPSALFGAIGLFAFGRALWWTSGRRYAALAGMFLMATDFLWFIQSRIAMLDMIMAGLTMVALWQFAAATRLTAKQARWRLAATGVCLGLALGAKWSVAPIAVLPGLAFLVMRLKAHGWRCFQRTASGPVPDISLMEAAFLLGTVPLAVYWLTFMPAFFYIKDPVDPLAPIAWHRYMLQLQDSVTRLHPYRSVWYQWIGDWRAVWYLYEPVDASWPARGAVVPVGWPVAEAYRRARLRAALLRDTGHVGRVGQADPVLLPLPAAERIPDGLPRPGARRHPPPRRSLALGGPRRFGGLNWDVRLFLPDHLGWRTSRWQEFLRTVDVAAELALGLSTGPTRTSSSARNSTPSPR